MLLWSRCGAASWHSVLHPSSSPTPRPRKLLAICLAHTLCWLLQVTSIQEMGAYVHLLEYDNMEGMIPLSEVSRRRIRSINKLVKVWPYVRSLLNPLPICSTSRCLDNDDLQQSLWFVLADVYQTSIHCGQPLHAAPALQTLKFLHVAFSGENDPGSRCKVCVTKCVLQTIGRRKCALIQ
jgi:hypothetical protein